MPFYGQQLFYLPQYLMLPSFLPSSSYLYVDYYQLLMWNGAVISIGIMLFHISFLNHFPNLKLVIDGGTVGMKEAPTSWYNFLKKWTSYYRYSGFFMLS